MQISDLIAKQKEFLMYQLVDGLKQLSDKCALHMDNSSGTAELNTLLSEYMHQCEYANLSYVVRDNGTQISANVTKDKVDKDYIGQDLSSRPFFNIVNKNKVFYLSDAYISSASLKPCISAVHAIMHNTKMIGMLVLDLDLEQLPILKQDFELGDWRQIKGDPEIRSNLFNQRRVESVMDQAIDTVHTICYELLSQLGVFHLKLHYASSRATIWTYDDPFNYHVHVLDEIISPNIFMLYPKKPFPSEAKVTPDQIKIILEKFKYLRFMDEHLYLKTASINIMNATIGLSFSCDGNHYLTVDDFLQNFEEKYA